MDCQSKCSPEIQKILNDIAEDEGLQDYNTKEDTNSQKGDGYIGVITRVRMYDNKKVINLIVKSASNHIGFRKEFPVAELFQHEIHMYQTIIPSFQNLEIEHGLPPICTFAKCYGASSLENSEAVILEDLKIKGYEHWERRLPMNEEHVTLVLKEYARFHALSLALRDQYPDSFSKLTGPIDDVFVKFFRNGKGLFEGLCGKALQALCPIEDAKAYEKFKEFTSRAAQFILDLPKLVDGYSVIVHGDGWANNILFRYDDPVDHNKPTRMCLIDLQLVSSKEIIANFQHYFDMYYDTLAAYLKALKSDPDKVYPYSVFCRQWKESAKFGLIMSTLLIKLALTEQDEAVDVVDVADSGVEAFNYKIANVDEYNARVKTLILHFVENEFI